MKLLAINPNTNQHMTATIAVALKDYENKDLTVDVVTNHMGVESVEGHTDEIISTVGILEIVVKNREKYDGFLIVCYSNHPAIHCCREITEKPVVGIFEASVLLACLLGSKFSIVTTSKRWQPMLEEGVQAIGLDSRLASVRSTGLAVLELDALTEQELAEHLKHECEIALNSDGAEVICLGCAGMAGMSKNLSDDLKIPVIDCVTAGLKVLEILVGLGLGTSKLCKYNYVEPRQTLQISKVLELIYKIF
ncbi:MAG: aspartate/glutamate racemase family protein [Bacillota bacterium]|jgi:allantoin racemase